MTNEQKKGLRSLLFSLGFIILLVGALTRLYGADIGFIVALSIWVLTVPALKVAGVYPHKEYHQHRETEESFGSGDDETVKIDSFSWKRVSVATIIIVLIAGALVVVGALKGISNLYSFSFVGSGIVTSETRAVSNFNRVELSGRGHLVISQTGEESLNIEAEDNLINHIEAIVENETLKIRIKRQRFYRSFLPTENINYYLTVDDIDKISILGSGSVQSDGLTADSLELVLAGSGEMGLTINTTDLKVATMGSGRFNLKGKTDNQEVIITGSGKYNAKDLVSSNANVRIDGSGRIVVNVDEELGAVINGSGEVKYVGNPKINQTISGSGSVSAVE